MFRGLDKEYYGTCDEENKIKNDQESKQRKFSDNSDNKEKINNNKNKRNKPFNYPN